MDGSSPYLPHFDARPRSHREQGRAAAWTPAHWPSWVLGPWQLLELSLGPGHQCSAATRPQDLGSQFLGPPGTSGAGASRACLRMSSAYSPPFVRSSSWVPTWREEREGEVITPAQFRALGGLASYRPLGSLSPKPVSLLGTL